MVAKMIEVTTQDNVKWLINTAWIEQIKKEKHGSTIYFAFNIPNGIEQDYMHTMESYEEIKMKVWGCNG